MRLLYIVWLLGTAAQAATLSGRVIEDHTGNNLASANVRIGRPGELYLAADLETGREGSFQASLPAGEYFLEVAKPGFAMTKLKVTLAANGTNVTARLVRRGVITGRVIDTSASPIAGSNVYALPKPRTGEAFRPIGRSPYAQITDAQGEYRIRDLPPGEYAIAVSWGASTRAIGSSGRTSTPGQFGSGFQFYPSNSRPQFLGVAGGEQHRNIDFTIVPGSLYNVSGTVEPADRFYWLALVVPEQPALALAIAQADMTGTFQFTGIPAGSYRLIAVRTRGARNSFGAILHDSPMFAEIPVNIAGADVTGVTLRVVTPPAIEFTLQPGTGCPAGASLELTPLEDWGSQTNQTVALKAGEATKVEGLAPMKFAVTATTERDACYLESPAMLDARAAGTAVEIRTAPAGTIRGKLDTGGRAPGTFAVFLAPAEDANIIEIAAPDAESRFSFTGLKPGRYRIAAFFAGARTPPPEGLIEFEVRAGSNAEIDLAAPEEVP